MKKILIFALAALLTAGTLSAQKKYDLNGLNRLLNNKPTNSDNNRPTADGAVTVYSVGDVSFKMIGINAATYTKYNRQQRIASYSIGETEVTQALWQAVMGDNPSVSKDPQKPVENVSWNRCQEFIKRLNGLTGMNFRLPSSLEWEYAALGGNRSRGFRFSGSNTLDDVAWHKTNSGGCTHRVAQKQPNEIGLYDMSGNVSEWCQDLWNDNGVDTDRAVKGGCYYYGCAETCKCTHGCNRQAPTTNAPNIGLRLAL